MENEGGDCGFCGALAKVKCSKCKSSFYCDRNCQKRDWKVHKQKCISSDKPTEIKIVEPLQAIDVSNLNLKVEVRLKSNGKKGVFTTDYVKKGELLCYYDGTTKDANTRIRLRRLPTTSQIAIVDAVEVFQSLLTDEKCLAHPSAKGYVKIASENTETFGIGQWIADSCKPQLEQIEEFAAATEELHKYQNQSLNNSNCQVNNDFWLTANRNLERGSELFLHYGFQYWLRRLMLEEKNDPERRFFYYSLNDQSTQIFNLQKFYEYDDQTCKAFLMHFILMPRESIENHTNVKELLFDLTMKNVDMKM